MQPSCAQAVNCKDERVVLLVLVGISLADWTITRPAWRRKHPDWQMQEQIILAQAPTITSVSWRAFIGEQLPAHP